jgi:succinyl-diaminopimelate desuccinylase
MKQTYLDTAKELISFRTTNQNCEELSRVISFVERYFSGTGASIKKYESGGKTSLVVGTEDALSYDVILCGHLDVVPAHASSFTPEVKNGRLYGRGACDMKSEIAVMMQIMREVLLEKKENPALPSVALMLTTDEEVGGKNGAGYLVNHVGYSARAVLIPDAGMSPENIIVRSKGVLHLKLTARGISAHGSRPWLGLNAIEKVMKAYFAIKEDLENKDGEKITEAFDDGEEEYWYHTCSIGAISGGIAANQIPDHAEAFVDIRFTENMELENIIERIKMLAEGCDTDVVTEGEASIVSVKDNFLCRYAAIVREITGKECSYGRTHGSDDGRYFTKKGMPVLSSCPVSNGRHSEEEWVDIASLEDFYKIYSTFVRTFKNSERK